jgi:hypothetical protein
VRHAAGGHDQKNADRRSSLSVAQAEATGKPQLTGGGVNLIPVAKVEAVTLISQVSHWRTRIKQRGPAFFYFRRQRDSHGARVQTRGVVNLAGRLPA